jgi:hypothetical protein
MDKTNPADKVEHWPIDRLVPYAKNSRTHSEEQIAQIAASIKEWGFTTAVLVDEKGGIIAGHGRVLAARKLGIDTLPVMVATGWTEPQKRAYVIADNQLALNAGWNMEMLKTEIDGLKLEDFDIDLLGFEDSFLDGLLEPEPTVGLTDEGAAHLWATDRKQTTILEFDRPNRNGEHPTMKPVELFAYQMQNNTKGKDRVLDSFGGSGTTLIAAEKHGRDALLMELDPKYCDVIIKRWQDFTGKQAIHAETGEPFNG